MAAGDSIYEIGNPEHWDLIYSESRVATPSQPRGYIPIPDFQIPFLFESYTVALLAQNPDASINWWLAVRAYQVLNCPAVVGGRVESYKQNIPLDRPTLLTLPRLAEQYQLMLEVPFWHQQMIISVWQYTGPEQSATDQLLTEVTDAIRVDLARIEERVRRQQI